MHSDRNRAYLRNKKPRVRGDVQEWTGVDEAANVLPVDIELRAKGALSAETLKQLGRWSPLVL